MPAPGQTTVEQDRSAFIPTQRQALGAMALVTQRGPIGTARLIPSWADFERVYGGFMAGRTAQHAVKTALDNGCHLLISRVVHYSDIANAATKSSAAAGVTVADRAGLPTSGEVVGTQTFPLRLTPGGTLVVAVDAGANQTATFNATRATITGAAATYAAVTASHKLNVTVNGVARSITFAGTENTQSLYLAAINDQLPGASAVNASGQVKLQTDRYGSGATIAVIASDADVLASLGLSVASGTNAGPNNVADVDAVTLVEFEAVVESAVSGSAVVADGSNHPVIRSSTTGGGSSVRVQSSSTLDDVIGFDNTLHSGSASGGVNTLRFDAESDGTHGNDLRVVVDDDPGDPATRFRVRVTTSAGVVLGTYAGLSMVSADPRNVVTVLRDENARVRATDLASATTAPANRPASGTYALTGGADGIAGLVAADYLGHVDTRTGLHAFDVERGHLRLVAVPGVADHDVLAGGEAWCAARIDKALFIASVPVTSDPLDAIAYRRRTTPYSGVALDSSRVSLFFGWHEVTDPVTKQPLFVPVEGEVFAAFARANRAGGPWFAAAGPQRGVLSRGVSRLKFDLSQAQMDALHDAGVNPVYRDERFGFVIWGQRNLQLTESALARNNVRLLVDGIDESVRDMTRSQLFEPNTPELWGELRKPAIDYLERLEGQRAIELGTSRVIADETNNTPSERALRRTHLDLYFVPVGASEEQRIGIIVLAPGSEQ